MRRAIIDWVHAGNSMRRFMLAGTAFCLLGAFFSLGGVVVAPMAFDAPGSDKLFAPWAIAIGLLGLPVSCVAAPVIAWAGYLAGWERTARAAMYLPLLWLVLYPVAAVVGASYCGATLACDGATGSNKVLVRALGEAADRRPIFDAAALKDYWDGEKAKG